MWGVFGATLNGLKLPPELLYPPEVNPVESQFEGSPVLLHPGTGMLGRSAYFATSDVAVPT